MDKGIEYLRTFVDRLVNTTPKDIMGELEGKVLKGVVKLYEEKGVDKFYEIRFDQNDFLKACGFDSSDVEKVEELTSALIGLRNLMLVVGNYSFTNPLSMVMTDVRRGKRLYCIGFMLPLSLKDREEAEKMVLQRNESQIVMTPEEFEEWSGFPLSVPDLEKEGS